jgi:hypothetical protein
MSTSNFIRWLTPLRALRLSSRVSQRLQNVLTLEIREIGQHIVDTAACPDLPHDHANSDSHAADTRLSTHHLWALGNTV